MAVRRLAEKGIGSLWVEAGLPADRARGLSHLYSTMLQAVLGNAEAEADLLAQVEERLQRKPQDYSQARIIGNEILAAHMMAGDSQRVIETANRNLEILSAWRAAEPDLGREYEDEELRWIVENAAHFEVWSSRFRQLCRLG
jgi:hypothetical protein